MTYSKLFSVLLVVTSLLIGSVTLVRAENPLTITPVPKIRTQAVNLDWRDLRNLAITESALDTLIQNNRVLVSLGRRLTKRLKLEGVSVEPSYELVANVGLQDVIRQIQLKTGNSKLTDIKQISISYFKRDLVEYVGASEKGSNINFEEGDIIIIYGFWWF